MSRYPVFGRPAGGYDKSLLQIAPQITRADRQQGYSVDILERGRQSDFHYGPNAPGRQPVAQGYDQHRFQQRQPSQQPSFPYDQSAPPSLEKADYYAPSTSTDQRDIFRINPHKPKKPWYRTKRGLVIIFIIVLVLAGGAVGIAFGVSSTMNKKNEDNNSAQKGNSGGGVGQTGAEKGGAASTDANALPSLPSLSLVTLRDAQQSTATTASQANLVISLRPAPTAPPRAVATTSAPAPRVTIASVAPTPTQVARTTVANVGPSPSVDPICAQLPSLPSCK